MRQYVQYAAAGLDREPMLRHADHLQFRESYGFLCYTKPAAMLQQLARWLGEDKVQAALRDYAMAWRFAHPTPEDFFASMNRSLGQDLDWYWSTWWTTTWTLDHAVGEVQNGENGATVVIRDEGRAPHPAPWTTATRQPGCHRPAPPGRHRWPPAARGCAAGAHPLHRGCG